LPNIGVHSDWETAVAVSPPVTPDVESVEKVIFEEKKEKAENYNLYIKNELQKESFCENDDLGTYSTDSLADRSIMQGESCEKNL